MRDYYKEIDKAIQSYEEHKSWHDKSIDWICNRIDWCNRWRKLDDKKIDELANRITAVLEGGI